MASTPTPRSFQQILNDMISAFVSRYGIETLNAGSPILSMLEAGAQSDVRSSQDTFDLLDAESLDNAEGTALDLRGRSEGVIRQGQTPSTGAVTISDTSFSKKATKLFQGLPAPIVGSTTIYVQDASSFPASGRIFLGRGTVNYEGPLDYSAKTNNGTYWTLTLSDSTRRFHNVGESVILGQGGDRTILAGTIVQTPQGNVTDAVQFATIYNSTIPDGEVEITGVQVIAQVPGAQSRVAARSIRAFANPPFNGAAVINPLPLSNGNAAEDDKTYRERIKAVRASRAKGIELAITTAVQGIQANDERKQLTSSSLVKRQGVAPTLYIDDGTGYEEISKGIAVETLVDSAIGGEEFFQVSQRPVAKGFLLSNNTAPFVLSDGARLAVSVGGKSYEHTFDASFFKSIENASAYEVAAAINSNSTLAFSAATADSGTRVRLFGKEEQNEDIEVLVPPAGTNANDAFLFSVGRVDTMRLYRNDTLLSKDGTLAVLTCNPVSQWVSIANNDTLIVSVDGTAAVTYTFTNQDFIDAGTGYATVGVNSIAAWIAVLNAKIPGIAAREANGLIELTSNAGYSSRAALSITGGTLISKGMFDQGSATGTTRDYTLDRNTGQLRLEEPLAAGDSLTVGTSSTRAFVQSSQLGTVSLSSSGKLWFVADGSAEVIQTGLSPAVTLTYSVEPMAHWGNRIRYTASSNVFGNVRAGDWMIAHDTNLSAAMRGVWRVAQCAANYIEVERRNGLAGREGHAAVVMADGKVLVTGGMVTPFEAPGGGVVKGITTATCELYDPVTDTWTPAASMLEPRTDHIAVRLGNGKVLVVGGQNTSLPGATSSDQFFLRTCELYDPTTDSWSATGSLPAGEERALAHGGRLTSPSEKVLVCGGYKRVSGIQTDHKTAYLYDPSVGTWAATGMMSYDHTAGAGAVIVTGSKFVVACGADIDAGIGLNDKAEVYTLGSGTWATVPGSFTTPVGWPGVSVLSTGNVLISGGVDDGGNILSSAVVFDPSGPSLAATVGSMNQGRCKHISTPVGTTKVLVGFGSDSAIDGAGSDLLDCELYDEGLDSFSSVATPITAYARQRGQAVRLADNTALVVGGTQNATTERYDSGADAWTAVTGGLAQAPFTLASQGLVFVRASSDVQEVSLSAGNYTATGFASALSSQLIAAIAKTHHTTSVRVSTKTYALGGDIALVAMNAEGAKLGISASSAVENSSPHLAAVESKTQAGTPEFTIAQVTFAADDRLVLSDHAHRGTSGHLLVGLKDHNEGIYSTSPKRFGHNAGRVSSLQSISTLCDEQTCVLRDTRYEWMSRDRAMLASHYSLNPSDTLVAVVDQDDLTKRYVVPMARKLSTSGAYANVSTFKDADNANASLAGSFGLGYDFNDFAVFMRARVKSHEADASKRLLWRYTRPGAEGNNARLRYTYPAAPSSSLAVSIPLDTQVSIEVALASGALKTGYSLRNSSKVGICAQASGAQFDIQYLLGFSIATAARTANVTTLTLTLPAPITDCGLAIGNAVYVNSTNVNFTSGLKTITNKTANSISYAETAADVVPVASIGTVSVDPAGEATFAGALIAAGDLFRVETTSSLPAEAEGFTMRINNFLDQRIRGYIPTWTGGTGTTPTWTTVGDAASVKVFPLNAAANTASIIASTVTQYASAEDSKCPVTATVTGTGIGSIDKSSFEEFGTWYSFKDGINYVKSTTSPGSPAGDYQFQFKDPITAALATDGDWANEECWVVPTTAASLTRWLNTPAVTGLQNACFVEVSSDGQKVQVSSQTPGSPGAVQVQGGSANALATAVSGSAYTTGSPAARCVVTVKKSGASGLSGGDWVRLQNTRSLQKSGLFNSSTVLSSWSAAGVLVLSNASLPLWNYNFGPILSRSWQVERQGSYVCYSHNASRGMAPVTSMEGIVEGSRVVIKTPATPTGGVPSVQAPNTGIFTVVRVQYDGPLGVAFWIENPNALEESAEMDVTFFSPESVMPGDTLSVGSNIWGSGNQGLWLVESVGAIGGTGPQFVDSTAGRRTLKVSTVDRAVVAMGTCPALGTESGLVQVIEREPAFYIKKAYGISPNQTDGTFVDVMLETLDGASVLNEYAGTVLSALDKLSFPEDIVQGIDGYRYNTGLLGEVNRTLYGDPRNPAVYPGVIAAGSPSNVSGPLVKRINVALALRVRSGVSRTDIANRVRSAVASVINRTGVGKSISISDLVVAATRVNGVMAVSMVSPTYNSENDTITVQAYEKPFVTDLEQQVLVSFVGD